MLEGILPQATLMLLETTANREVRSLFFSDLPYIACSPAGAWGALGEERSPAQVSLPWCLRTSPGVHRSWVCIAPVQQGKEQLHILAGDVFTVLSETLFRLRRSAVL